MWSVLGFSFFNNDIPSQFSSIEAIINRKTGNFYLNLYLNFIVIVLFTPLLDNNNFNFKNKSLINR